MSRIGKKPIQISDKIKVSYADQSVKVEGEKGVLTHTLHPSVGLEIKDGYIHIIRMKNDRKTVAFQGLARALVANMVTGVSHGFERILEINGIGYRAEVKGKSLILNLGYSHPVDFSLPDGITAQVEKNVIKLNGIDKELLGHTAAAIRKLRPPEPFKGKGIKYAEEHIQRKAGKTGTK
jgi:large subunit ribosomal protein L6